LNPRRILLVKTSSMGDVIHNFPVVSDLSVQFPEAQIDWLVEEAFAPLLALHAQVREAIPVAVRRWRADLFAKQTWREIGQFRRHLQARAYDVVIDTQGLLKSALLVACATGRKYGLDWPSSREPIGWFYHRTFSVPWDRHAVERNRSLAALAMQYPLTGPANYALHVPEPKRDADIGSAPRHLQEILLARYAVLLHATSARNKEWLEQNWMELGSGLHARGIRCVLPFGTAREQDRSERLANGIPAAVVPARWQLDRLATLLSGASLVVGVDTGLTHLGAALGRPTIGLYSATDPRATGLYAAARSINLGGPDTPPSVKQALAAVDRLLPA
jgi:heptosyltransferase-1